MFKSNSLLLSVVLLASSSLISAGLKDYLTPAEREIIGERAEYNKHQARTAALRMLLDDSDLPNPAKARSLVLGAVDRLFLGTATGKVSESKLLRVIEDARLESSGLDTVDQRLVTAIENDDLDAVDAAIAGGANVNFSSYDRDQVFSPLEYAIMGDKLPIVERLLADPGLRTDTVQSALKYTFGHTEYPIGRKIRDMLDQFIRANHNR